MSGVTVYCSNCQRPFRYEGGDEEGRKPFRWVRCECGQGKPLVDKDLAALNRVAPADAPRARNDSA